MDYKTLYQQAYQTAVDAASKIQPKPITIKLLHPLSPKQIGSSSTLSEGVCGMAWVDIESKGFGRWMVKQGLALKNRGSSGVRYTPQFGGQSYERRMKFVTTFAKVLEGVGVRAWGDGRLD